ncbi:MAG: DNA ligase [Paraglaciecola sp.]|nr:DNA ligase [Paraglaciecola sp.]
MIIPKQLFYLLLIILLPGVFRFCSANQLSPADTSQTPSLQQLARLYQENIVVQDYWISEKLDGIRGRWTGSALITRNGNMIHAPTWFVKDFPPQMLDGELWLARNSFEKTASIILRDTPNQDWQHIKFMLFDLPKHKGTFSQRLTELQLLVDAADSPYLQLIAQFKLTSKSQLTHTLDKLVAQGAEGLMLNHQAAYYQDGRSAYLLKLKKHQDAEARVIAHLPGKGKYQGMLGSLLVELVDLSESAELAKPAESKKRLQFKIGSGFSDLQRRQPPPVGSIITFKYYGLTARGIPRFASFLRVKAAVVEK